MARHYVDTHTRQRQIVRAIREYTEATGMPPSLREIAEAVGLSSCTTVGYHLRRAVAAGTVVKTSYRARPYEAV